MTLKTRRLLFYFLLFSFVTAATIVIFYSIGYRVDFENFAITETGGIYVRSNPARVDIFLDGEGVKNEAGLLNSGTLVDNLSPGLYSLDISMDGYSNWHKGVEITPGAVSVFDSIVLLKTGGGEKIFDAVDGFGFVNTLLLTNKAGKISFDGTPIQGDKIINFTESGNIITQNSDTGNYYLTNILNPESATNLSLTFNNLKESRLNLLGAVPIVKIEPYPFDDSRFIIMTARALYALNPADSEISQIDPATKDFIVSGNEVLIVNESGISNYNLVFETKSTVTGDFGTAIISMNTDSSGNNLVAITDSGRLIHLNRNSGATTTISSAARYFSFSPNDQLLVFEETSGAIKVYDFEEEDDEKKIIPLIELDGTSIREVVWYENNAHIFLKDSSNNLKFVEIDDSMPINEVLISESVNNFVYDEDSESLYYGNDSGIWQLSI